LILPHPIRHPPPKSVLALPRRHKAGEEWHWRLYLDHHECKTLSIENDGWIGDRPLVPSIKEEWHLTLVLYTYASGNYNLNAQPAPEGMKAVSAYQTAPLVVKRQAKRPSIPIIDHTGARVKGVKG
jgi:hypothetical protein